MSVIVSIPTILRPHTKGKNVSKQAGHAARGHQRPGSQLLGHLRAAGRKRQTAPLRQHLRQRRGRPVFRRPGHCDLRRRHGHHPAGRRRWLSVTRYDSLLAALGNTPLVGLPRLSPRWDDGPTALTCGCGPNSKTATRPARSKTVRRCE
ncbi:O-phosphoserine sulfhydrylase domain protein [Mycobacterium xenopi 4042]|uniref:O-phosphoserine sulfhydrylase domain protein n=1 Tax=Mycobacterium xenopi 4042 TaxID=1299334 RepID=X8E573_MYCXE|nr:O-phosphoserine sulfhydrylase domain protein [Mycobacterium xenopi 4042]